MPKSFVDTESGETYTYIILDDETVQIVSCTCEKEEIEIPTEIDGRTVTSIGEYAFEKCRKTLKNVIIPASVVNLDYNALRGLDLTKLSVAEENEVYYSQNECVIEKRSKTLIIGCKNSIIPNDVTSVREYAFSSCVGLTSITIPSSVRSISFLTFDDCNNLEEVVIEDGLENIGDLAFKNCNKLTQVTLPDSVKMIEAGAFYGCNNLTIDS